MSTNIATNVADRGIADIEPIAFGFTRDQRRNLLLASLGSLLEFYEFMVFGFFTVIIGKIFFPPALPDAVKTLEAFALYSLGFLLRPLSGLVIGHLGDKFGRKLLFMFTIFMMAVPTTLIGLMPTYAAIGIAAPLILLVLRLLQGLAIAGEYAGVSVFITEHISERRVGTASGFSMGALYIGFFLGAAAGALMVNLLDSPALESWGWRIPFLIGGLFGLLSVYLRRRLDETPLFLDIQQMTDRAKAVPAAEVFRSHLKPIIYDIFLGCYLGMMIILLYFFMPVFLQTQYGFDRTVVFNANAGALLFLAVMCPLWGRIADKIDFSWVLGIGALGLTVCFALFFRNVDAVAAAPAQLRWWWFAFSFFMATAAVMPALLALVFPTRVRFTGMGFAYNAGVLISAAAPTILSWIVLTHGKSAVVYYAIALGALGIALAIWTPRLRRYPKPD